MSIDMLLMAACSSSSSSTERSGVGEKSEATNPSSERNQSFRKKSFNWTISTQYTQQYYHLFQTFNMPWRRGTARKSRGLPIQISRLIITNPCQIHAKSMPKSCQIHVKVMPKSCQSHARVCQSVPEYARVLPSFAKIVPKSSPSHPQVVPR